jgi:hypothetical protein
VRSLQLNRSGRIEERKLWLVARGLRVAGSERFRGAVIGLFDDGMGEFAGSEEGDFVDIELCGLF